MLPSTQLNAFRRKTVNTVLALGLGALVSQAVFASTITLHTRYSTAHAQVDAAAYRSTVLAAESHAATNGYGDKVLSSFNSASNHGSFSNGSSSNVAFHFDILFNAASSSNWSFRIGPDFGYGGAVYLDGVAVAYKTNDMWWNGNYSTTTQDFEFNSLLSAGNHTLDIYGLEGCCDGAAQAQFKLAGASSYTSFSDTDGHNPVIVLASDGARVPEPTALSLLGVAAVGMIGVRRRKQAA